MISKNLISVIFGILICMQLSAQVKIKITHQPYLQALTDSTVSLIWTTNKDAIGWVELAPDDQSHFYQQKRAQHFSGKYGIKKGWNSSSS